MESEWLITSIVKGMDTAQGCIT